MIDAKTFNNLTRKQQYELLKSKKIKIVSERFLDAFSKTGDTEAVITCYQARVDNIALTEWETTKDGLINKAKRIIEKLNKGE